MHCQRLLNHIIVLLRLFLQIHNKKLSYRPRVCFSASHVLRLNIPSWNMHIHSCWNKTFIIDASDWLFEWSEANDLSFKRGVGRGNFYTVTFYNYSRGDWSLERTTSFFSHVVDLFSLTLSIAYFYCEYFLLIIKHSKFASTFMSYKTYF